MIKTTLGQLRIAGILDGISLVVLLFIAMPLKYWADIPMAVTVAGSVHGVIFVSYVLVILYAQIRLRWNIIWSMLAVVVAFIPFGNFIYDWQLKKMEIRFQN